MISFLFAIFYEFMIEDDHVEQVTNRQQNSCRSMSFRNIEGRFGWDSSGRTSNNPVQILKNSSGFVLAQDASIRLSDTWHSFY